MIMEIAYQGEKTSVPTVLTVDLPSSPPFPACFIGRNSYIVSAICESSLNFSQEYVYNMHVGNFSALAHDLKLVIDINHDYAAVCTGNLGVIPTPPSTMRRKGQILIQNDVWVGRGATIMGGVTIHNGAVVAAGAVVTKDVAPYSIVGGNPARLIRYRFDEEIIRDMLRIQWWDWPTDKIVRNQQWFAKGAAAFAEHFAPEAASTPPPAQGDGAEAAHRFLYFPDFNENFPTWKNVIPSFARAYAHRPDCHLTLFVPKKGQNERIMRRVEELLATEDSQAQLYIHFGTEEEVPGFFVKSDYYVTNRTPQTVYHSSLADLYGAATISGVDIPIFPEL